MTNPIAMGLSRNERRRLLEAERRVRASKKWPAWWVEYFPLGSAGTGWASEFSEAHVNGVFSVLDRTLPDGTRHLMVTSLSGIRPTWSEMQRIKNDIAGAGATAVEVYPPEAEVVDEVDAYHLWVLPARLPFSLKRKRA